MKEIIGIAIIAWLLWKWYCFQEELQEWKRKQRHPQATARNRKPTFLKYKK